MGKYLIYDAETENHTVNKRFANPFSSKNWVVYRGWKEQGDTSCSYSYHPKPDAEFLQIRDYVSLLVGFNFKFDLLYEWKSPALKLYLKRGGKIWCCQYAEYLLNAQHPDSQMCSLDSIVEKYGGKKKIDEVKILWDSGMLTSQIDKSLMVDYLIGTEEESRNGGDIGNTEKIFLGQVAKAKELGMLTMIQQRMDGLLATTEMEFNGLKIDIQEARRRASILEAELQQADKELQSFVPELPDGLEFNWSSNSHRSCLIFGGAIPYKKKASYIDPKTGEPARYKAFKEVEDGVYVSGRHKGDVRYRKVEVQGDLRERICDFSFKLPRLVRPQDKWQSAFKDAEGNPIYQTNVDVIDALKNEDVPFIKAMNKRQDLIKDLSTYYIQYDPKKKDYVGMLTHVDPETHIVHHNINHTNTVTTRLSSDHPNLQNIPTGATSEVKKMFISRFKGGKMLEIDFSQLEVVVQGVLSGDANLCKDLRDKIDFHCKRVAAKFGITYEQAMNRCKNDKHPEYDLWKERRRGCKEFSFQRAYGAGAAAISQKTGMTIEDVKKLIEVEDTMYPGVKRFNSMVESCVKKTSVAFRQYFEGGGYKTYRRGYWVSPTGTRYSFRTYDAMDWQREKGIQDSFMPTELKNYPVQGFAGEIVQTVIGRLFRLFASKSNYTGKALLCNTVHDCVWIDCSGSILVEVSQDCKRVMESVPQILKELYNIDITVPFPVSIDAGDNLFQQHGVKIDG